MRLALALVPLLLSAQIRFEDVAQRAGISSFQLNNGATGSAHQIELMPAGVAALDFNNDGCMEIGRAHV